MQGFKNSTMEHLNMENLNKTENYNNQNRNCLDGRLTRSYLPNTPDSGYKSLETSPQNSIHPYKDTVKLSRHQNYGHQLLNPTRETFTKFSLYDTPQVKTQRKPTACERLAILVNSIPAISNDSIYSSPEIEIKRNKSPKIQQNNEQPFIQEPNRSHLYGSSCREIEIPSLQQSTIFTTPEKKYIPSLNIIPTNKYNTASIKNLAVDKTIVAEHCNKQLHQANVFSTNKASEFHNLHPQQKQFYQSNKPVHAIPEEILDFIEQHSSPKDTWKNTELNWNNDKLRTTPIPLNSKQKTQLQKSVREQPNYSRHPHTETSRGKEFATDTRTNIARPLCPSIFYPARFFKPPPPYPGKKHSSASLTQQIVPNSSHINISPTSNIITEMKYETQSGPPTTPSHLTSSGVEPPHSSQASGIVMGDSPAEVVGVDSLLLSPWAANGPEFLEGGVPDVKQTAGFQDTSWVDSLMLGSTVNVASAQSIMEIKAPLPAFTNYTGHLSINGISGHHYHTIASSGQRSSVSSASPTPSSNQEYYESPVVSSSTPCPQVSQKHQPQNHQQQQQQHPHPQNQHQQQQQLPQSTQQMDYDIEDIAEIIGSAIADTTVPGNGNGPSSEQTSETSRDWIDIADVDWILPDCSPKTQETTSPNSFAPQIYVTTTPTIPTQQHTSSTLQNLLSQNYAPLLQARLQAGNATGLQNASCGETPSSTSPYPPLSPPNRVSTSCSPDDLLHSSFATPSHPRKRSRSSPGSGQSHSKKNPAVNTAVLPYGAESEVVNPKKPVHRCNVCSRAFLNKSNIKVHLRTHTGEKPFKCDVCSKAFRQKAHLIKHQQIHKRGGRE